MLCLTWTLTNPYPNKVELSKQSPISFQRIKLVKIRRRIQKRRIQKRRYRQRRRKEKALRWDVRHQQRFMHHANQFVGKFWERLKEHYISLADPSKRLWFYVEKRFEEIEVAEYETHPRNMACNNLLVTNNLPAGTTSLLGLGLNYCIKSPTTTTTTSNTFSRLMEDIRWNWKYIFRDNPPLDENYIPKLYIKSEFKFDPAPEKIEKALQTFQQAVQQEQL